MAWAAPSSALVALSLAASAGPGWIEVGRAADGTKAFVDASSLTGKDGVMTLRQRFVLPPGAGQLARVEQTVAYSCRTRTAKELHSDEFGPGGKLIRRFRTAEDPYRVREGSLVQVIMDLVC